MHHAQGRRAGALFEVSTLKEWLRWFGFTSGFFQKNM